MKKYSFFPFLVLTVSIHAQSGPTSTFSYSFANSGSANPTQVSIYLDSMMAKYHRPVKQIDSNSENSIYYWSSTTLKTTTKFIGRPSVFTESSISQIFRPVTGDHGSPTESPSIGSQMLGATTNLAEQHNANKVFFSHSGTGVYAILSSGEQTGISSISLLTGDNKSIAGAKGEIAIYQGLGSAFGMYTSDSTHAQMGWNQPTGKYLTLSAAAIQTDGIIETSSYFISQSGFISAPADVDPTKLMLTKGTIGVFGSKTADMSSIEVRNWYGANVGIAGIHIGTDGSLGTLAVYPDNFGRYANMSGSLVIQSNTTQGIMIDLNPQKGMVPSVHFAIAGTDFGSIGPDGFTPPSMSEENMLAISKPRVGASIFNTTRQTMCFYTGRRWKAVKTDDDNVKSIPENKFSED